VGGRGGDGAGGSPVTNQPIEFVDDIPPELRDLFLSTVKAARHVQGQEIKDLHAKLKDATRRGYDLAVKNLADTPLYLQWWESPYCEPPGTAREHLAGYLADVAPGGRFWEVAS
jgi:hypothetical protein